MPPSNTNEPTSIVYTSVRGASIFCAKKLHLSLLTDGVARFQSIQDSGDMFKPKDKPSKDRGIPSKAREAIASHQTATVFDKLARKTPTGNRRTLLTKIEGLMGFRAVLAPIPSK